MYRLNSLFIIYEINIIFLLLFLFNAQLKAVAADITANPQTDSLQKIVHRLSQVLSKELPLQEAEKLLDNNLVAYMNGKKVGEGKKLWYKWVQFLHYNAAKKIEGLVVKIEKTEIQNSITIYARWHGLINGKKAVSDLGTVTYQVQNGKITNIWTHKANYVFIYGDSIKNSLGFYWVLLRLSLWNCPSAETSDLCE